MNNQKIKSENETLGQSLMAGLLNRLLADEYVLYTKTRNAHWHMDRQSFYLLHRCFEMQAVILDSIIDDVAEQILSLGSAAPMTLKNFLNMTHLHEVEDFPDAAQTIRMLLDDHETIINIISKDTSIWADKDMSISHFITDIAIKHENLVESLKEYVY